MNIIFEKYERPKFLCNNTNGSYANACPAAHTFEVLSLIITIWLALLVAVVFFIVVVCCWYSIISN
jgi:hypothetical protein